MSATKTIPAKACQFAADIEIGDNGGDSKTAPIKILARSGNPVVNWFWGRVVHDMSGMVVNPRIPLDYCHCEDEVMGYLNHFDTASGNLVVSGAVIPFEPTDRATEVLFKSRNGVPYQASIFFGDDPLAIEEVSPGAKTFVNGQELEGPLTVIRQWSLRGVAVCPYGNDPNTTSEMKFSKRGDVTAHILEKESRSMSATAAAAVGTEAKPGTAVTTPAAATETTPAGAEVATTVETSEGKPAEGSQPPAGAPVEAKAMSQGQKFLTAFGDKGGRWFAEGKTFDEAQALHASEMTATVQQQAKEIADLKAKLTASRGEPSPVTFSADPKETPEAGVKKPVQVGALSASLQKVAGAIKLPGKK